MTDVALSPADSTSDDVQYLEERLYNFNGSASGRVLRSPAGSHRGGDLRQHVGRHL
jgi:hypothetical protein